MAVCETLANHWRVLVITMPPGPGPPPLGLTLALWASGSFRDKVRARVGGGVRAICHRQILHLAQKTRAAGHPPSVCPARRLSTRLLSEDSGILGPYHIDSFCKQRNSWRNPVTQLSRLLLLGNLLF